MPGMDSSLSTVPPVNPSPGPESLETTAPQAQRKLLDRALSLFGDRILVLHVKDGVFGSEGKWENRPLGQGVMDWANLLPELRAHNDDLCALREDVWPGMAREECALLHRWIGE